MLCRSILFPIGPSTFKIYLWSHFTCTGFTQSRWHYHALFQFTHLLGRSCYMVMYIGICVLKASEIRVTICVIVCSVRMLYVRWWWWRERRRWNQVLACSLLLSISTKGSARLNILIWQMNCYQQYIFSIYILWKGLEFNLDLSWTI